MPRELHACQCKDSPTARHGCCARCGGWVDWSKAAAHLRSFEKPEKFSEPVTTATIRLENRHGHTEVTTTNPEAVRYGAWAIATVLGIIPKDVHEAFIHPAKPYRWRKVKKRKRHG